ncbi:MAG: V4R domain-containing protein [Syntrophorhabdales bacterium]|jgi:predicted hydrocarbon binding protein
MREYTLQDIRGIARPLLGEDVPLTLFRILRIIGMRSLLGEASGHTLYIMGKSVGNMLNAKTVEDFKKTIRELRIGIPEIEVADEDHVTVKLYECITCAGFPFTGEMFCDMESGIIAGLLEKVYGKKARSTQVASWSAGSTYCAFDVVLY